MQGAVSVEGSGKVLRLERSAGFGGPIERVELGYSLHVKPTWFLQGEWIGRRERTKPREECFIKAES